MLNKSLAQQLEYAFAAKELKFGNQARAKMLQGCDALTNAVQVTLGPMVEIFLIDQSYSGVKIPKDDVIYDAVSLV